MDDPLEYLPFSDVLKHGDPSYWKFQGRKTAPAKTPSAPPQTLKVYEYYEDSFGDAVEVHYFRHSDGSVSNVKVVS